MPRKRSRETTPEYGTFIVSSLYNAIGLMYFNGENVENAVNLREAIILDIESDETRESITKILERAKPASILQWRRFIHNYVIEFLRLLSRAHVNNGEPDPFRDMPKRKYNNTFLDLIGYEWRFQDFVIEIRAMILYSFELIVSGRKENIESLVGDAFSEFVEEPEQAVSMIWFALLFNDEDNLVQLVDDAVKELHSRLFLSPEFSAAVELVEKRKQKDGPSSDIKFGDALNHLTPMIIGRIRDKGLFFPRLEVSAFSVPSDLSDEESFVMKRVWVELLNRATENPIKFITDKYGREIDKLPCGINRK